MPDDTLEKAAADLVYLPPLLGRVVRRRLTKAALADCHVEITPLHHHIMRLLGDEGPLHLTEIGERIEVPKAQMTQLVDRLVTLGMVDRNRDAADRRAVNIGLTERGRVLFQQHRDTVMGVVHEAVSGLTQEELEDLSGSLRKLRDILLRLK